MKKTLNILSTADLSVLALWLISFVAARLTAETAYADGFAAAFVIIYAIAAVAVVAYTIASVTLLILKKKFSLSLLITAYITNIIWIAVFAMVMYRFATAF
jgi:hypothetical protein